MPREVLDQLLGEGVVPKDTRALELLQMVYRGEVKVSPQQMRAAIESLPFESPKLIATASAILDGQTFAELLDRAIERSQRPLKLIEGQPVQTNTEPSQVSTEVMKKPFVQMRRRI
jgi:hypothetical protein